ncbi:MAG: metal-dependent transcriptional regulator [Methanoregulaceae archaeon]|nr:metal-dependent transcriptional regulator [Methanoregulaceae archaeon]MCU0627953.1 metal-dependent transcriptional regulator [Methanoregulaceae archaeon]
MEASSLREDILEALYKARFTGTKQSLLEELALTLGKEPGELRPVLIQLEQNGELVFNPDGSLSLTPAGNETGGRVMRKHRILECFFSEMLGMSPDTASEEACTLEHGVSDEAIERLGRYIRGPGRSGLHGIRRGKRWQALTLLEAVEGDLLVVSCVRCRGLGGRLHDLGLFPGTEITVVRKIPGNGIVVRVKECDIALSTEIAASILVERAG